MRRNTNEHNAYGKVLLGMFISLASFIPFGISVRNQIIILAPLSFIPLFLGLALLFYGGYSLGWEYKRRSLDAKEGEKE